jgi:hypothetical protein
MIMAPCESALLCRAGSDAPLEHHHRHLAYAFVSTAQLIDAHHPQG